MPAARTRETIEETRTAVIATSPTRETLVKFAIHWVFSVLYTGAMKSFLTAGLVLFPFALACSSTESASPPTGDDAGADAGSMTTTDSGSDASTGNQTVCMRSSTLVSAPPAISGTKQSIANVPTATGGTIEAGTYKLTATIMYTDGPLLPSNTNQITLQLLANNEWAWSYVLNGDVDDENLAGGTYAATGTEFTFTTTCARNGIGTPTTNTQGYIVNGNNLTLLNDNKQPGNNRTVFSQTFTKQ